MSASLTKEYRMVVGALYVSLIVLWPAGVLRAASVMWNPNAAGSGLTWLDSGNWMNGKVPDSGDDVLIENNSDENTSILGPEGVAHVSVDKQGGTGSLVLNVNNTTATFESLVMQSTNKTSGTSGFCVLELAPDSLLTVAEEVRIENPTPSDHLVELRVLSGATLSAKHLVLGGNRNFPDNTLVGALLRARSPGEKWRNIEVEQVVFDGGSAYLTVEDFDPSSKVRFSGNVLLENDEFRGNVIAFNLAAQSGASQITHIEGNFEARDGTLRHAGNAHFRVDGLARIGSGVVYSFFPRDGGLHDLLSDFSGGFVIESGAEWNFSEMTESASLSVSKKLTVEGGVILVPPSDGSSVRLHFGGGEVQLPAGDLADLTAVELHFDASPATISLSEAGNDRNLRLRKVAFSASQVALGAAEARSQEQVLCAVEKLEINGDSTLKLNGGKFLVDGKVIPPGRYGEAAWRRLGLDASVLGAGSLEVLAR